MEAIVKPAISDFTKVRTGIFLALSFFVQAGLSQRLGAPFWLAWYVAALFTLLPPALNIAVCFCIPRFRNKTTYWRVASRWSWAVLLVMVLTVVGAMPR